MITWSLLVSNNSCKQAAKCSRLWGRGLNAGIVEAEALSHMPCRLTLTGLADVDADDLTHGGGVWAERMLSFQLPTWRAGE